MRVVYTVSILAMSAVTAFGAFSPADLGDVFAWYVASEGVTTDGSGVVTAWADQSGNGHNLTAVNGPDFVASDAQLNGTPAIDFDEANDDGFYHNYGSDVPWTNATIMVVCVPEATAGTGMLVAHRSSGALIQCAYKEGTHAYGAARSGTSGDVYEAKATNGTVNVGNIIYTAVRSDGNDYVWSGVNGVTYASRSAGAALNPTPARILAIGCWSSSTTPTLFGHFNGRIAEVLVYSKVLTGTEENQLGIYLSEKYGLDTGYDYDFGVDFGAGGSSVQSGFIGRDLGSDTSFTTYGAVEVTLSVNSFTILGRNRGNMSSLTSVDDLVEDFIFNDDGNGIITMQIGSGSVKLPAGAYAFTGYFNDSLAVDSGLAGNSLAIKQGATVLATVAVSEVDDDVGSGKTDADLGIATFTFQSDGVNPVVLTLDGVAGGDAGRFAFNGFEIEELPKGTVICIR